MSAMSVTDYPQLAETLVKNKKIVYLCGAGASMSLGNHGLSWANWILAGKDYLTVPDRAELDKRIGSWTSEELIGAVTFLLEKLKSNKLYERFMDNTIGSLRPSNKCFETALQNVLRAGDLIATTNYDLLIEGSAGAEPVTYSSPANILSVIRGDENRVIHLHGAFDKANGIDDIIADASQYDDILANAGAQFIQNLIGTYPIVIVGCGGTVDDPNLSGFMSFAVEKLKVTDIPYFYLMKKGDAVPGLPDNAVPVYYGDDYSDLPKFLSEMSLLRLRERSGIDRLAYINPYVSRKTATTAFGRMHFSNGFNSFVGRESEIESLNEFLESKDRVLWRAVFGEGGIGKSRLVLEWLKKTDSHWFGFFARKLPEEAAKFIPFTDTVIVFDYVLGDSHECAEMVDALLNAFDSSPYKLRILFIERSQQNDEWLKEIKRGLDTQNRLEFEASEYADPLTVTALTQDDEIQYIENYLTAYLPILKPDAFIDSCNKDIKAVSLSIDGCFKQSVEAECQRPLYLSIFTEVWIEKRGQLSVSSAKDLMDEYLNREKNRWRIILGDVDLVDSYMRLLAVACAIGHFNITDVYGNNYLAEDCSRLVKFFDDKSSKPGADNLFDDLFVYMDELVEDDSEDIIDDFFFGGKPTGEEEKKKKAELLSEMDEDDRFAFSAPYIKLHADPTEVYLNMLADAGAADDDEIAQLEKVKEARIKRVGSLPDHAWIIEPILPTVIKEYIASYVINERDVVRFTKLARSNSILGFESFLSLALEDSPENIKFQKMIVTPPDEVLNYFEYYISLIIRVSEVADHSDAERALINTDPCFTKYELDLWRRISYELNERGDVDRIYDSGCNFFEYLKSRDGLVAVRDEVADIVRGYCVGLHDSGELEKNIDFLQKLDDAANILPKTVRFGELLCESFAMLINLKLFRNEEADIEPDWKRIQKIINEYECSDKMCVNASDAAHEYLLYLIRTDRTAELNELEGFLEELYERWHIVEIAEVAALTTANIISRNHRSRTGFSSEKYNKLKAYLSEYPKSKYICSAFFSSCQIKYMDSSFSRKVPDKIIQRAKKWSQKFPDELEFQEAYFGLLLSRLEYEQKHGRRSEEVRLFREMKKIAERTDYSQYNEDNQLLQSIEIIQSEYGY